MSDEELAAWVVDLITRKAPESDTLDYKKQLSLHSKEDRVEFGKDVSSFANERGGVLLYGVPEVRVADVPIPVDLDKCGMPPISAKPADLENILLDTVRPVLPELDIRLLTLQAAKPIPVLFIHHPRSWNFPHMVQGYDHGRYYRRGNYRAVIMSEYEVEAAYSARRATMLNAQAFFDKGTLCQFPPTGYIIRITACPVQTITCRRTMEEKEFREWLFQNTPADRAGDWIPFLDGVRFSSHVKGPLNGKQFEYRIFHNGALSFTLDLQPLINEQQLDLQNLWQALQDFFFVQCSKAFNVLHVYGPIVLEIKLRGFEALTAFIRGDKWFADLAVGKSKLGPSPIVFYEETSDSEIQTNMAAVVNRVMDRLAGAFGIWRK